MLWARDLSIRRGFDGSTARRSGKLCLGVAAKLLVQREWKCSR